MRVTYQAKNWSPEIVKRRYVRAWGHMDETRPFIVYEVGPNGMTYREYVIDGAGVPAEVLAEADRCKHQAFGQVEWPL